MIKTKDRNEGASISEYPEVIGHPVIQEIKLVDLYDK